MHLELRLEPSYLGTCCRGPAPGPGCRALLIQPGSTKLSAPTSRWEGLTRLWVRRRHPDKVLCILWLGSSIGNLEPTEALQFFRDMLRIGGRQTQVRMHGTPWRACTPVLWFSGMCSCCSRGWHYLFCLSQH